MEHYIGQRSLRGATEGLPECGMVGGMELKRTWTAQEPECDSKQVVIEDCRGRVLTCHKVDLDEVVLGFGDVYCYVQIDSSHGVAAFIEEGGPSPYTLRQMGLMTAETYDKLTEAKARALSEQAEQQERAQYERLKAKYG